MKFLKTLCLFLLLVACRPVPVIDYATAFKNCPIDTITSFGPNDTMFYYQPDIDGFIGAQLPDFVATSLDGKTIDKNYFADRVSVINFWFEGCHPCEEEMPGFNKLVERYDEKEVNFLAIGRNSPKDIEDFLKRKPFNFDHIAYGEPLIRDTFHSMWGYPLTLVADKQMRIVFIDHGGPDDTTAITKIQKKLIPVIEKALASN